MTQRKVTRRVRRGGPSPEEARRFDEIRKQVRSEFPPRELSRLRHAGTGLSAKIRAAREAQGLTWYTVAKRAGIPNSNTIRDIEVGRDVKLSNLQAVAAVLGLKLELVEASA